MPVNAKTRGCLKCEISLLFFSPLDIVILLLLFLTDKKPGHLAWWRPLTTRFLFLHLTPPWRKESHKKPLSRCRDVKLSHFAMVAKFPVDPLLRLDLNKPWSCKHGLKMKILRCMTFLCMIALRNKTVVSPNFSSINRQCELPSLWHPVILLPW